MPKRKHHYYIIYKPYGLLCQFTPERPGDVTLKDLGYTFPPDVYPAGRLDKDSEGLLLLTNDNSLKTHYLNPSSKTPKTYCVQVEGEITTAAIRQLEKGVVINISGKPIRTLPAKVEIVPEPRKLPERNPPIRFRKNIATSWISITIIEGKNRQIRKMTGQAGFPTLRLVRTGIGALVMNDWAPGSVSEIEKPGL